MTGLISNRLLDQRLRTRMIELLEMLADWQDTISVLGARSYFNTFFDCFPDAPPLPPNCLITAEEDRALTRVLELMDRACSATSQDPTDQELIASGWPPRIAEEAKAALQIMMVRGKFSDDVEVGLP